MTELATPRIDAHLHSWRLGPDTYEWLTPELGELYRDFPVEEAADRLESAGIESAILVQAEDTVRDTEYLLDIARSTPWVSGVVGWIPLERPADARLALDRWLGHPEFCGVRQLIHIGPDREILRRLEVVETLSAVAAADLAFDVPDAWPRLLGTVPALADALPDLRIVIDHLGKPPVGSEDFDGWAAALRDAAARPNTYGKVSGLQGSGRHNSAAALRRSWDIALEAFGPRRLAFGSDWPMTVPSGGYEAAWSVLGTLIGELSPSEQGEILAGTARRIYKVGS